MKSVPIGVLLVTALFVFPLPALAKKVIPLKDNRPTVGKIPTPQRIVPQRNERPVDDLKLAKVVQDNKATMILCYQRILRRDPTLTIAKMVTKVKIESDGHVTAVSFDSPLGEDNIGECLAQTIKRWSFPPASRDYDFEFPLMLSAE